VSQRVKDPERWIAELERPLGGGARNASDRELQQDADSFMAFASAFGVALPRPSAEAV